MLDVISAAAEKGWHITSNIRIKDQNWAQFEHAAEGRKIFLFGLGEGAEYFYFEYRKRFAIEGIIDNDKSKHGYSAEEFLTDGQDDEYKNIKISDISCLKNCEAWQAVVLITNLRHYEEIARQLEEEGIGNYFALLPMEVKKRQENGWDSTSSSAMEQNPYSQMPIEERKLVFSTQNGYCGHGRAIAEQLLKQRKDLDIVWVVKSLALDVPEGIRLVYSQNRRKYLYEMSTARMWIYDYTLPDYVDKRPGQTYIQVKHWSSITLKVFGFREYEFSKDKIHMDRCIHDSRMMDYIITGSEFDTDTCRKGFDFHGEVIQAGSPRSDILFQGKVIRNKVYEHYQIDQEKKLVLYAPTWRYKKNNLPDIGSIDLDFENLEKELRHKFGGSWRILLRLHPLVALKSSKIRKPEYVIDASSYGDSEELVAASDVMVTDYSSIMFEPAFVKKPVFLYAPDREDYINIDRELLIDYNTLPFPTAESNEELAENIRQFDQKAYEKEVDRFMEKYGVHEDGHASERAAAFISDLIS